MCKDLGVPGLSGSTGLVASGLEFMEEGLGGCMCKGVGFCRRNLVQVWWMGLWFGVQGF